MQISLVPVRDEAESVPALLDSLRHQTRAPDEIIAVVDAAMVAGSIDWLLRDRQ